MFYQVTQFTIAPYKYLATVTLKLIADIVIGSWKMR
jgi:hypothetical protein